ncbi:alanine racemase [Hyphomonas neptunium ATCC 15444]|uniref:Alanine racemase n=3 Tax=Hyphomonadaceae TaxID=69657 RepID=Q0BZI1_HYPNA|nr:MULTISPECIES: alanine racemase [Hyphomonas]ABI77737.1 alanine racemase [Hyphomonas neptunium ATCC 15444]KCZ95201.1 alanine racemase [Hyphomonas hirschiana VP5]
MVTEAAAPASHFQIEHTSTWHPSTDEAGRLTIDMGAIAANYRRLRAMHPAARVAAVVKADAYGLDATQIAPMLAGQGARDFFVAHLAEALVLKPLLPPDAVLFVLNGLAPGSEPLCAEAGILPVLNTPEQARAWYTLAVNKAHPVPAALQVDTGMSRLGLSEGELNDVLGWPSFAGQVNICLLMTHMACADTPGAPANADQMRRFADFAARLPSVPRSLANSAAAMFLPEAAGDVLRPGLVLYGVDPGAGGVPKMQPAIALEARIIQLRHIPAGAGVGYGFDYIADRPLRVATLSAGYADGWPRALSNGGATWFAGHRLPILGRVSMDSCMVDVTNLPEGSIRPGDCVELIGPHQSVNDLARQLATTPHEILTSLGRRFTRSYINPPSLHGEEAQS